MCYGYNLHGRYIFRRGQPDMYEQAMASGGCLLRGCSYPNLTIIEADALKFPYNRIESRFKVVANLPYYISTPILFRLIELRDKLTPMTIMLQKEVANRIVASPGCKDYGILSIAVQFYAIPTIAFEISRTAFYPVPEVDSAVLKIIPREKVAVEIRNEGLFWGLIKSAFYYRRKTLLNSLTLSGYKKENIKNVLDMSGIDPNKRPEAVSMEERGRIADNFNGIYVIPKEGVEILGPLLCIHPRGHKQCSDRSEGLKSIPDSRHPHQASGHLLS